METVTIKTAIDSGKKTKDGKPVVNIVLSDGRKGAGFDEKFLTLNGQSVQVDIKEGKEWNGEKPLIFNLPSEKKPGGFKPFADKKTIALQCAAQVFYGSGDAELTIKCAEKFYSFLNS